MKQITIPLQTVTPLFIAGADARGKPELRPPAFRGALRYWLRALLGGVYALAPSELREKESAVFGSAEVDGSASSVSIRIPDIDPGGVLPYQKGRIDWVNLSNGQRVRKPLGKDYLYYSMDPPGGGGAKQYYPSGTYFSVVSALRPGCDSRHLDQAMMALWLLLQLGGVGSRSRHTGGSLSVREDFKWGTLPFQIPSSDLQQASTFLRDGITTIRESMGTPVAPTPIPEFDILAPGACRIWTLGNWPSADQAINAIGDAIWSYRSYSEPDHANVRSWLNGNTIPTIDRAIFGLPISYRYTNGPSGIARGRTTEPKIERRASPLWLKVSKAADGKYIGIATLFKSRFLPQNEKIHEQHGHSPPVNPPPDFSLIENFITNKFTSAQEVHYV